MKKLLFAALAVFAFSFSNAQDEGGSATSQGTWLIEANTGNAMVGSTAFTFTSQDGESVYNLGLDGGYFISDDLAVRVGLGFGGDSAADTNIFSYRLGAKYYLGGEFPIGVDLTGASIKDAQENPLWLGLQGGYAWFITDHIAIEPGLRYNLSLNEDFTDEGVFQFNIGFTLFL
ncbi:hypothetical protein [Winogradskyella jejuensis]|uniref:Outer membrane protein beta-barrel domain-containing protein n=1 Tax=Winogradskyella jejuensis TaxID=1089305 RepID=A0A1M5TGR7_9FLAO|nr:hypothetical protein [Winogradskyella jejuensis]SHH49543.1 hypothetical protein SAMN05444148_2155 [Winogradskyella jejuensis]